MEYTLCRTSKDLLLFQLKNCSEQTYAKIPDYPFYVRIINNELDFTTKADFEKMIEDLEGVSPK